MAVIVVKRESEYPRCVTPPYQRDHTNVKSRGLLERGGQHVPALAVAARPARQRDREDEVERRNPPLMTREVAVDVEPVRREEIRRRAVLAMLVLHALEDRELALRAHVH